MAHSATGNGNMTIKINISIYILYERVKEGGLGDLKDKGRLGGSPLCLCEGILYKRRVMRC